MNIQQLKFPSGRTVARCKQDAKHLVKELKLSNSSITLNEALNQVAVQNGLNVFWDKALKKIEKDNIDNPLILRSPKTPKLAQTHLLGHALNKLISKNLINMESTEDAESGYLECELEGKLTIINWHYVGFGEIRLSVWWNFDKTMHPQHLKGGYKDKVLLDKLSESEQRKYWGTKKGIYSTSDTVEKYQTAEPLAKKSRYKDFIGVICGTWVERKDGKYLQTEEGNRITNSYVRKADKEALCKVSDCIPNNFSLTGKLHM
jgi:hypothetical protein